MCTGWQAYRRCKTWRTTSLTDLPRQQARVRSHICRANSLLQNVITGMNNLLKDHSPIQ